MKENSNIEDFFRKRLENDDFSYQESDWVMLEQRLDAAALPGSNTISFTPVKLAAIGVVVVIFTFLAGWFTRDYFQGDRKTEPVSNMDEALLYPQRPPEYALNVPSEKTGDSQFTQMDRSLPREVEKATGEDDKDGASLQVGSIPPPQSQSKQDPGNNPQAFFVMEVSSLKPGFTLPEPVFDLQVRQSGQPTPVTVKAEKEQKQKLGFAERWEVGIALAPDFNSVGISNSKTVTALIGGQLYFRLSERWTFSSGALLNRKKYMADGEAYSPPSGWSYQDGSTPEEIDGSCKVIDIPVMVAYQWTANKKVNFATSAGLSNYILLDERYRFLYGGYYGGSSSGWSTDESSKIMWGVANFSVAVSVQLSERLQFTAEPYLKKPLKDIGWGNVDLVSTGTLFSMRYNLFGPGNDRKPLSK